MSTTYLNIVNDVLVRLREPTVATVTENEYSSLIGKLVNDAKREVEDAWDWECLKSTYSISTVVNTYSYSLTGAGSRSRIYQVCNDTRNWFMQYQPTSWFTENLILNPQPQAASPEYYNVNGVDSSGDIIVDFYPKPNAIETIRFDVFKPENELTSSTDTTKLPKNPIVALAWAKAIEARGEDGGVNVSSQYAVAKQSLADHIAIEAGRRPDEQTWYWV